MLERISELLVPVAMGTAAWALSRLHPALDTLVTALLGGLFLTLAAGNRWGIARKAFFAQKILIPAGIILYGTNLRFDK